MEELLELYKTNDDFKGYVDRYCWSYNLKLEVALTHGMVKSAAEYYMNNSSTKTIL